VALPLSEVEPVPLGETPAVREAVGDALTVELPLTVEDGVAGGVPVPDPVGEAVAVGVLELLPLLLGEAPCVIEGVAESDTVVLGDAGAAPVGLAEAGGEGVQEDVGEREPLCDAVEEGVGDAAPEPDAETVGEVVGEGVDEGEGEPLCDEVAVGRGEGVPEPDSEAVGESVGEGEGVGEPLRDEVAVEGGEAASELSAEAVGLCEPLGVAEAVGLPGPLGVAEGVGLPEPLGVSGGGAPGEPDCEGMVEVAGVAAAVALPLGVSLAEGAPVAEAPGGAVCAPVPEGEGVGEPEGEGGTVLTGAGAPVPVGEGASLPLAGALDGALTALLDGGGDGAAGAEALRAPLLLAEREAAEMGEGAPLADCELVGSCGSSARPPEAQRKAKVQGAGSAAPPAHQKPALQATPEALVEPAGHHAPGGAPHGPLQVAFVLRPVVFPNLPAGQRVGTPLLHHEPRGQGAHTALLSKNPADCVNTRSPEGDAMMGLGELRFASAPKPTPAPATPLPATVVTQPRATSTRRTRCPAISVTNSIAPEEDRETPMGLLNAAADAGPSAKPGARGVPASVSSAAASTWNRRTTWFERSAMYTRASSGDTAM
jgi:hypothetical protein